MALSQEQLTSIAKILFVKKADVIAQIASLGSDLTEEDIASIGAAITQWDSGVGDSFLRLKAKEANFGAETDANDPKNAIRSQIAILLGRPDWIDNTESSSQRSSSKTICFQY